ncbi:MAG: aminoacyl-tRNA hydrolase [Bacteroidetes bacterium]|nr:aminoacyl-tRNA hydrolase [Bacteroidota bacterium]
MKFLIAGLGNIGNEYANTRHNIGFDILDAFAERHQLRFHSDRLGEVCEMKFKGKILILVKPSTYMNLSGKALKYWLTKEKIPVEHSLTLVDDLAFPLDTLKIKKSGSDAGHNGLKSIHENLGTTEYPRLRFGIGNHFEKHKQVDFVLGKWEANEIEMVQKKIIVCCDIIESFVTIGLERTMNQFNHKKF